MFDGVGSAPKVSLAGRSGRRGESRAEFLRRSAREREDRERKRVRDIAATKIQAFWRSSKARQAFKGEQRALFDARLADVEKVARLLPDDKKAVVVMNALRNYLLRPFGFFYRRSQDASRILRLCPLVEFTSQQPAATNFFAGLLAEEEAMRHSTLAQSWKVIRALLSMGEVVKVAKVMMHIRNLLFDQANEPVHAQRSPATIGFLLRHTQILDWALEQDSWYVNWEDARTPASYQIDVLRVACLGLGACPAQSRRRLILQVLSAARLLDPLETVTPEEVLWILRHFALGPPPDVLESAPPLEEEADERDDAKLRMEIFAGNAGSIFPGFLHLGEPPREVLGWLMWLKAKLPVSFWKRPGGPKQARWRHKLWSPQLVDRLYRAARGTPLLDRVLSFYYEEPTNTYPDTMQEFAFRTDVLVQIDPMTIGWSQLDSPSYRSGAAIRLVAWCVFFQEKLRGTFDVEIERPEGWWSYFDHDRLWPHLNLILLSMFRDYPDPGPLSDQGKMLRCHLKGLLAMVVTRMRRLNAKPWWLVPELRAALQDKSFLEISANVSASLGVNEGANAPCEAPQNTETASAKLLEVALAEAPQMVPFEDRVAVLQAMIHVDKMHREDTRADWARASLPRHRIRRDYLMEDGFAAFERLNTEAELRSVFVVEFVATDGSLESGIDGGGLFKEFMIYVCRAALSPEYGLFSASSDETIHPFPTAHILHPNAPKLYKFLGKVIGKAIYEQMLLEHQFSRAFLNRLLDKLGDAQDLASMDRETARGIAQLRHTENIQDLGLTFSTTVPMPWGTAQEVDLCQNGRFRAVTQENVDSYVQFLMDHRVTAQMMLPTMHFMEGLKCVIPLSWLRMFDARELGIIISGSSAGFDVADLRANTVYNGGYTERSQVIRWLWDLLENQMDTEDLGRFLMFATSCSRPPLLGFKSFDPKFCIHKVDDASRLPTASTCANLLKLPAYNSQQILRDKLLQAIRSESGFDLS